jgi:MoaA/NifB/PqqE/SkfB family radical SAM enzyme
MTKLNHVFIRLLDTCNLECAHCYASCGPKAPDQLPLQSVLSLAKQLSELETRHVHLEGGEALIYRGVWDVIDALNEGGIRPAITSNGLIVDEKMLRRMVGRVSKLTFSVDGHVADVHDQIRRRKGSFDRVTNAIRRSHAMGIPTHMISVVWRRSVDHVEELVALAESLEVDRLLLFSCGSIGAAVEHADELSCDMESWSRYLHKVRALAMKRDWIWFEIDRVKRSELADFIGSDYRPICVRSPRDSVTIDPKGDVYPCGYFIPVKKSLGNIADAPIGDIVFRRQDGERYSGACKNPWKIAGDGVVELCKLYSINGGMLPGATA